MDHIYFIPCQPRRTKDMPEFRTHISHPHSPYNPMHPESAAAQVALYRWTHSADWVNGPSIADLHQFLMFDWSKHQYFSKHRLGNAVVQSTIYNPRKLKAKTKDNPYPKSIYVWKDKLDLQYGLEWQICMWLYKIESDRRTAEDFISFLEELITLPVSEVTSLYIEPTTTIEPPDWNSIWQKFNLYDQEFISKDLYIKDVESKPRPKLKSLSK